MPNLASGLIIEGQASDYVAAYERVILGVTSAEMPRRLVAFGEQRDRFASAAEVQKYAGVAPVTE